MTNKLQLKTRRTAAQVWLKSLVGFLREPVRVLCGSPVKLYLPFHVLGDHVEGVAGPDIANGVAALVGGAVDGVGGAGAPLVVGQSGVRLQSMTEENKNTEGGLGITLKYPTYT